MKKILSGIFKIAKKKMAPKKPTKVKKTKAEKGMKRPAWPMVFTILFWLVENLLTGCSAPSTSQAQSEPETRYETGFMMATPGNYDSADYAVLTKVDLVNGTMQFENMATGLFYTLDYDGATSYEDAHGVGMAAAQLSPGMITYITFMKTQKRLNSLALLPESFHYDEVTNYVLDGHNLWIGDNYYSLSDHVVVLSENGPRNLEDLAAVDVLTFYGTDKSIKSIYVNRSHSYLELTGDSFFEGGFLEVSNRQIVKIEPDMRIAVPAGEYEVTVSAKGCSGTEKLTFVEGQTTKWDVSGYEAEVKETTVSFKLRPEEARIYIDGDYVDSLEKVTLTYGLHHIIAVCDGYATISDYIKVQQENQEFEIIMEKKGSDGTGEDGSGSSLSENSVSDNSISGNSISENTISGNNTEKSPSENEAERLKEAAEEAAREHGDGSGK
ncbi:MAG: DUF1565 domain-containing protein [Lachnospiraceae bacterium]|nr:DUF1565 domain-containing protein [Lachnospiraceae bacterium]